MMRIWIACGLWTIVVGQSVHAQPRDVQRYSAREVEGRLMAFYSAALAFSPVGQTHPLRPGGIQASLELSYVPSLDQAQRSAGYDKPEATNLAPVFPRPRIRIGLPGGFAAEASWLPPARVFDVTANLAAVAVTTPVGVVGPAGLSVRLSGMAGRITGPITCNAQVANNGAFALRTYYRTVCRDRDSKDYFEPRHFTLELAAARPTGSLRPFVGVGARLDAATRFDIGVVKADGTYRDPDHPILELRSVRPQLLAGTTWRLAPWGAVAGEAFYAPGSLLTVRTLVAVTLR